MRIYPPELEIGDKEGFSNKDIFGQKELGEGMSNLVSTISDPLVIAFDGKWGSGKTTFLKMWAGELRKNDFPVIFFDAFENDYNDDAFAVLLREVFILIDEQKPKSKNIKNFKEKSKKLGVQLLKGVAKIGIKAAIRIIPVNMLKDDDIKEVMADITNEAGDVAESYVNDLLSKPQEQKNIVSEFRKTLEELPALIAPPDEEEKQKPLIFIIDELDRCKPLFALQILERIKHFMSVPNVHFVFGVNLEQLEQSVKFAYGADIDATTYLQKFINLTINNTDTSERKHNSDIEKYINHLATQLELSENDQIEYMSNFIKPIALEKKYSFRTLERIFTNIALALAFSNKYISKYHTLIAGLCILKVVEPKLFLKAKEEKLEYSEIEKLFNFSGDDTKHLSMAWECVLKDEMPKGSENLCNDVLYNNNLLSRKQILAHIANKIVDRFKPA